MIYKADLAPWWHVRKGDMGVYVCEESNVGKGTGVGVWECLCAEHTNGRVAQPVKKKIKSGPLSSAFSFFLIITW